MAEAPGFVGSDDLLTIMAEGHRSSMDMFRELTQGTLHWLCCILQRCWILRWRITHVIFLATHLSRIASISSILFLRSKFLDDTNTMSWVMPSWSSLITKSPWNNCMGFEERCTKNTCFQVVSASVRKDKWRNILMLELWSVSFFTLAVTKPHWIIQSLWFCLSIHVAYASQYPDQQVASVLSFVLFNLIKVELMQRQLIGELNTQPTTHHVSLLEITPQRNHIWSWKPKAALTPDRILCFIVSQWLGMLFVTCTYTTHPLCRRNRT